MSTRGSYAIAGLVLLVIAAGIITLAVATEKTHRPEAERSASGGAAAQQRVVVSGAEALELNTLRAQVVGLRTAGSLPQPNGQPYKPSAGTFVVITLRITNLTQIPQQFDRFADQTRLQLGDNTFTEPKNVAPAGSFGFAFLPIQPGMRLEGSVIYDVPNQLVGDLGTNASLEIANFGDSAVVGSPRQIGVIRLQR
ncbi:MAG: hypothetical protein ACJ75Z_01720 [Solirubrobacterales bacterium]